MKRVKVGIISGLIAGVVFGLMMTMMGMLQMIAGMVGSSSIATGWVIHLIISAIFGAVFAYLHTKQSAAILFGLLYGAVLWILFPLILMPMMTGIPVMTWSSSSMSSLIGHLVYGLIMGISYRKMGFAYYIPQNKTTHKNG